jgi:hypothetical protein
MGGMGFLRDLCPAIFGDLLVCFLAKQQFLFEGADGYEIDSSRPVIPSF